MAYQPKSYRKFVATAATATLVASAVAPAAAAGFTDVSDRYSEAVNYLVENDITSGFTETTFGVSKEVKRGDAAVMIAKALGLDGSKSPDAGFSDVPARAKEAVNALKEAGIFNGKSATNFGFNDTMTRGEMALVIAKAYKLEGDVTLKFTDVSDRYESAVKALVENKITTGKTETSFGTGDNITRGEFAIFLYRAEVLDEAPGVVEVTGVSAIDVNKIEVKFNKAVDTEAAVVKLTKGLANYNVTTEWNKEGDTVVITSVLSKLSPADYTVKVEGLTEEALTAEVKVEAEKAAALEVTTSKVDVGNTATVYFNVLNQYGTKFTTVDFNNLTVTTSESIADVSFGAVAEASSTDARGNLKGTFTITDADSKLKAGDTFKVTAVYDGLTATSNVTFVDPIDLSELSFGQVSPLKDKSRITVGDQDLVVPYTAIDQYGGAYELDLTENITWVSSNSAVVDVASLDVNSDGELTVDAGNTAGTAIVTAILPDGTTAQFSVTVEAEAYANTVSISAPTSLIADGEEASLDIVVQDQFGEVIPNKDVTGLTFSNGFAINPKTGKLEGTVTENSAFKVTATRTSDSKELASVTFAVEAAAEATTISSVNFNTLYEVGASKQITTSNVVVKDQYGRTFTPQTGVTLVEKDATNVNFSETAPDTIQADAAGTKVYTVVVDGSASAVKDITVKAVASADVTSYELAPIGTVYNGGPTYAATPELVGKTADGKTVVLQSGKIDKLTSSNTSVAVINGLTVEGAGGAFTSTTDAAATIKAWAADGTLLGSADVTVTNTAPALTTIEAADTLGATIATIFDAEDQYGVAFNEAGTWYFTDATGSVVDTETVDTMTLDPTDGDGFDLSAGTYNVKFISEDGKTVAVTTITLP